MARLVLEDWFEVLDPDSKLPMHAQLTEILLDRLGSASVDVGDILPGEWDLADHFKISRNTARRAYGELVTDGFLRRKAGVGTVLVQKPGPFVPTKLIDPVDEFCVAFTGDGACSRRFVEESAPPHEVQDFLGGVARLTAVEHLEIGGRLLATCTWWFRASAESTHRLMGLRSVPQADPMKDGQPSIDEHATALEADDAVLPLRGSIREHLELEVVSLVVSTRRASRFQAQVLDLGVRSPVLEVHASLGGADGAPAAYALATWAGDEFGVEIGGRRTTGHG